MKDDDELTALIKRAIEEFNKLTPEQQEEILKKQRENWARQDMD